jgi:hypothetical protein
MKSKLRWSRRGDRTGKTGEGGGAPRRRAVLEVLALEGRQLLSTYPTTTSVASSTSTLAVGQPLMLTATVSDAAGDPTPTGGTVTFLDGSTTLGSVTLSHGTASFITSTLPAGSHAISAVYSGSDPFLGSTTSPTGTSTIATFAGGDGGKKLDPRLGAPWMIAVDKSGDLFIADRNNNVVREVTPAGIMTTFAGNGTAGHSGDGGEATSAQLNDPIGVAIDAAGDVFISDFGNNVVREVKDGVITTFAGKGSAGHTGDGGAATTATLNGPDGLAFDAAGDLFIAEVTSSVVREVKGGIISTVAGTGTAGYAGNGGAATSAQLDSPVSLAFDAAGDLFIADLNNGMVREVKGGIITTYAGTGPGA